MSQNAFAYDAAAKSADVALVKSSVSVWMPNRRRPENLPRASAPIRESAQPRHFVDEPRLAVAAQLELRVEELALAAHAQRELGAIAVDAHRALDDVELTAGERRERGLP